MDDLELYELVDAGWTKGYCSSSDQATPDSKEVLAIICMLMTDGVSFRSFMNLLCSGIASSSSINLNN